MTLALPDNRVGHYQCGYCFSFLVVDCRGCQKTRDCKGNHADCSLDEVAWYKASFSIGKHGKPCCSTCIQPWATWIKRQNNKVEHFMKYGNQICEGCTVTLQIPNAPAVAVAAVHPVAAAPAAAPMPQPVHFAPQPPPPPPQPQNFNQAMITLRTMETKVAVLEAQMQAMSEKMEETMAQMQLKMEHQMDAQTMEMDAQARRMNEKIEASADEVAVLEAEVEVMSQKIVGLQLTMEEKGDVQEARDDEQFVKVSVEQPGLQWHNIKSSNESDVVRLPHDMGRLMLDGSMLDDV